MLKGHENIEAWLSTALRYRLQNRLHAMQRVRRHIAFSLDQPQYEGTLTVKAIDEIGRFEAMDSIMAMMKGLPRDDCDLLRDRYLRQRTVAEMAREKRTTPGTIRAFLSKARRNAKNTVYIQYAACI